MWGLRFLEIELSNRTDVIFDVAIFVLKENTETTEDTAGGDLDTSEYSYLKTTIGRDSSARVLIPLELFRLPVLDGSFFMKDGGVDGSSGGRSSSFLEKNAKVELNACIKTLTSRIKVRWESGRNNSGELNIKEAMQAGLQTSVMDVLFPDPLTFGFRLARDPSQGHVPVPDMERSVLAHDMTPMEVLVHNNTKQMIKMDLSITCRDVAGENCVEGPNSTVLFADM